MTPAPMRMTSTSLHVGLPISQHQSESARPGLELVRNFNLQALARNHGQQGPIFQLRLASLPHLYHQRKPQFSPLLPGASRSFGFARVKQEKQPGAGVVGLATRMELPLKGLVMLAC